MLLMAVRCIIRLLSKSEDADPSGSALPTHPAHNTIHKLIRLPPPQTSLQLTTSASKSASVSRIVGAPGTEFGSRERPACQCGRPAPSAPARRASRRLRSAGPSKGARATPGSHPPGARGSRCGPRRRRP